MLKQKKLTQKDYPSSAVKYYSPPILLIYIALGCCVVKRLFVQKWFKR